MLKAIYSLFSKNEETVTLDEAFDILTNDENNGAENENNFENHELPFGTEDNYACIQKIGFITNVFEDEYEIDGMYLFQSFETFNHNDKVSFIMHNEQSGNLTVSNVKVIVDDWAQEEQKTSKWCVRSLVCKVVKRDCRNLFLSPGDLWIDLNTSPIDFVPIVGDWLNVNAKCMLDEEVTDLSGKILEILKISPLRNQILTGVVKKWNNHKGEGLINQDVYFNNEALTFGYLPVVKDNVIIEMIESDQTNCNWRALKVLLNHTHANNQNDYKELLYSNTNSCKSEASATKTVTLMLDHGNSIYFDICLENHSEKDLKLLQIQPHSNNEIVPQRCTDNLIIRGGQKIVLEFMYKFHQHPSSFDFVTFLFENFKLTTHIFLNYPESTENRISRLNRKNFDVIKGQKLTTVARFIEIKLPDYAIPSKLRDFVFEHLINKKSQAVLIEELAKMKPSLALALCYNIYEDKFHALIHIQEIKTLVDMEQYNMERACFVKDGEYLLLEIKNLSERRPSLIVGDKIMVHDLKSKFLHEGIIHKVGSKHVHLKFAQMFHDSYNNEDYSITVEISRMPMRKLHQAISLAFTRLGREFLFPTKVTIKKPQLDFTYEKYSKEPAPKTATSPKMKMSNTKLIELLKINEEVQKISGDDPNLSKIKTKLLLDPADDEKKRTETNPNKEAKLKLKWFNKNLNYYQKEAVRNVLLGEARPLPYIIFGPPGTGKTITIIEIILQLITMMPQSRILVASPSNSSADLIASRLINTNVLKPGDLIRLVGFKVVHDDSIPLDLIPYSATMSMGRIGTTHAPQVLKNGLTLGCGSSVVGRHRITIGTCVTLASFHQYSLPRGHFTHIIVDESGQAMEPEIMIPLSLLDLSNGQIILAGDPMQLGPVVSSSAAEHFGLKESYLERLVNRFPYARDIEGLPETHGYDPRIVTKLLYNYRSLSETLDIYNKLFYHSDLKATICSEKSAEAKLLMTLQEALPNKQTGVPPSVVFHGVLGENFQTPDSPSWFNPDEASCVFEYVNNFYKSGLNSKDIGIIAPYTKQVKYLRTIFAQAEFDCPKIGSVEEFQGQEFNVIILSTVRSQSKHISTDLAFNLGFVTNPRRVNVALSRSKCLTVIIGNPYILTMDATWRTVIQDCIVKESYCGCEFTV